MCCKTRVRSVCWACGLLLRLVLRLTCFPGCCTALHFYWLVVSFPFSSFLGSWHLVFLLWTEFGSAPVILKVGVSGQHAQVAVRKTTLYLCLSCFLGKALKDLCNQYSVNSIPIQSSTCELQVPLIFSLRSFCSLVFVLRAARCRQRNKQPKDLTSRAATTRHFNQCG